MHEDLAVPQIGNVRLDNFEIVGLGNIGWPGFQNDLTIAIVLHEQWIQPGFESDELGCADKRTRSVGQLTDPLHYRAER